MPSSEQLRRWVADPLVRVVVTALLARASQPDRTRVVRFHVRPDNLPAYFDQQRVQPRSDANGFFGKLAAAGFVQLHWQAWQDGQWLEAVDLSADAAAQADLYAACGQEPVTVQRERLRSLVLAVSPQQPWFEAFKAHPLEQLAANKSPNPLRLDDSEGGAAVLQALSAIDRLDGPSWERQFSVQVFGDSKRFETVRRQVISVLRRFSPVVPSDADDRTVLRLHQIERTPELILLSGPVQLETPGGMIDVGCIRPYGAFPAVMSVVGWRSEARQVLTVENLTPFLALAAAQHSGLIVVYTGGFASPVLLRWLQQLASAVDLTWSHWGDIDGGGLRILAQLRRAIPMIRPVAMDTATLTAHPLHAEPLQETEVATLRQLLADRHLADCHPVLSTMIERRCKLEQEAVPAHLIPSALFDPVHGHD